MKPPQINELAEKLKEFFQGRDNTYGVQCSNGGYQRIEKNLSLDDFKAHLEGKKTLGIYLIDPQDNKVNFCAIDIDNLEHHYLQQLIFACDKVGLKGKYLIEYSGSKGYHILFRFKNPTLAGVAKQLLETIVNYDKIGIDVEIFPKQARIATTGYGNLLKLPLGIHRKSKKRSHFIDPYTYKEISSETIYNIQYVGQDDIDDIISEFCKDTPYKEHFSTTSPSTSTPHQTDYQCITNILTGVGKGSRDICLFNLCIYFLKNKSLSPEITTPILIEWNKKNTPPLPEEEIHSKIDHVNKSTYHYVNCKSTDLNKFCKPNCPNSIKTPNAKDKKETKKQVGFLATDKRLIDLVFRNEKESFFAVFDKSTSSVSYTKSTHHNGIEYIPFSDDMIKSKVILLPMEATVFQDEYNLIYDIKKFIHKYLELDQSHEDLSAYYILFTYLADCFDVCPYLRFKGDYGTGKSRAITVIGSLCYKAVICGGATTTSPIFRLIDKYRGTLILDEADFKNSEATDEIIKILTTGYMKGVPVLRSEKNKDFETRAFFCYSPKILGTRFTWKDKALESRCITIEMKGKTRNDIPYNINLEDFYNESLTIRNKLLMFRFIHYGSKRIDEQLADMTIEPRLNQIMLPLLTVVNDENVRTEIRNVMRNLNRQLIEDRNMSIEGDVLKVILDLYSFDSPEIKLSNITDKVNDNEDSKGDKDLSPRKVGYIIGEKLQITKKKMRDGVYIIPTFEQLEHLKRKYGLVNE